MSSEIAYFSVDSELEFSEYTGLLYEHAYLELETQADHLNEGGVIEAVEAMKERSKALIAANGGAEADVAYFFASRAVRLAAAWYQHAKSDPLKKKLARDLFEGALTYTEKVKSSAVLKNVFNKLMNSVKSSLPERERLKKLQMENVEDDASAIADKSAKELDNALEKGSGGGNAAADVMYAHSQVADQIGEEGENYENESAAAGDDEETNHNQNLDQRELKRQQLLRAEQEALRLQQQHQQNGFDFDSLVTGGGASAGVLGATGESLGGEGAQAFSIPPPPSMPPPESSVLTSSSTDAVKNLQNQFNDAISIVNNDPKPTPTTTVTSVTPPAPTNSFTSTTTVPSANQDHVTNIQETMKPLFDTYKPAANTTPITNINQMPAPTPTNPTTTAAGSKVLDEAREFLKSTPAPTPAPALPKKQVSFSQQNQITTIPSRGSGPDEINSGTVRQQQPVVPTTTRPTNNSNNNTSNVLTTSSKPQQLLPQKRMFQFGRGAAWCYPRLPKPPQRQILRRRGLVNLGNSCYLNSVVQCLCCTPIREAVTRENLSRLACALNFVFKSLRVAPDSVAARTPVGPSAVKSAIASRFAEFGSMRQQDANEFFVSLLDQICDETHTKGQKPSTRDIDTRRQPDPNIAKEFLERHRCVNNSPIGALFSFQTRQMNMCNTCGENARNFDVMMTLDLPIPLGAPPGSVATLNDCLCMYTKPDVTAPGRDAFFKCENCRTTRGSTHQTSIFSCPKILVITLKRFRQVGTGNFSDKINVPVIYPIELDLSPFMLAEAKSRASSTKFKLVGHVSHQGNTHGGHYTATTCDANNDRQWWYSSDERVVEVGGNQADFAFAYMLFYVRQD